MTRRGVLVIGPQHSQGLWRPERAAVEVCWAITDIISLRRGGAETAHRVPWRFLQAQIDGAFEGGAPAACYVFGAQHPRTLEAVAERLRRRRADNIVVNIPVWDGVGRRMLRSESLYVLYAKLLPLARVLMVTAREASRLLAFEKLEEREAVRRLIGRVEEQGGKTVLVEEGTGLADRYARGFVILSRNQGEGEQGRV